MCVCNLEQPYRAEATLHTAFLEQQKSNATEMMEKNAARALLARRNLLGNYYI